MYSRNLDWIGGTLNTIRLIEIEKFERKEDRLAISLDGNKYKKVGIMLFSLRMA